MPDRLAFAMQTAYEAGRTTLAWFNVPTQIERKGNDSPVTVADREAERYIRRQLAAHYPGEAVYGEEEGGVASEDRWVIDPIDGTKSFIAGVPLFATLLSYEQDGKTLVAAAYFPALEEMVAAERGLGTTWNGRVARVSQVSDFRNATICCAGHKSIAQFGYSEALNKLAADCLATRTWSDAYGHLLVATGRVEAMIDPILEPYDISAMRLIVTEAGGRCTTLAGAEKPTTEALSTNGILHDALLKRLRA